MPSAATDESVVIEVFGEGKTDIGDESSDPVLPEHGVVPIIVHRLCRKPETMRVKTKPYAHLVGKGRAQKVKFAKRQAMYNGSCGIVFVMDTEGNNKVINELMEGRNAERADFPTAVGAPKPCIEAWLLSDPSAIRNTLQLTQAPIVPSAPESLPAPCLDKKLNPKAVLDGFGANSSSQKHDIARRIDLNAASKTCPKSFEPFAQEVTAQLAPLFSPTI